MPSFRKDTRRERNLGTRPDLDPDWQRLLGKLPAGLDELAWKTGALMRRRVITSGQELLHLMLVYAIGCLSLRDAAAWAARTLKISVTGDALRYRFARALGFVQALVAQLLTERVHASPGATLRLVDGTGLNGPGSKGTDYRLHVTYSPVEGLTTGAELTGPEGGEGLHRARCVEGDVLVGDRAYGHARDVRATLARRTHCVLRVHLLNLAVATPNHRRLTPLELVRAADRGCSEHDVAVTERGHDSVSARLIVTPLPQEKAARARQKLLARARKKGKTVDKLTLRLAGYFCCVTTLPREQASVETVLACYRLRWQIELLFKRCKSLLHLDHLTRARDALVRVQVWARMLVALLIERFACGTREAALPNPAAPPPSPWRLTRIHWLDILLAVYGGSSLDDRLGAAQATAERLREHPRRRQPWPAQLSEEVAALPRAAWG